MTVEMHFVNVKGTLKILLTDVMVCSTLQLCVGMPSTPSHRTPGRRKTLCSGSSGAATRKATCMFGVMVEHAHGGRRAIRLEVEGAPAHRRATVREKDSFSKAFSQSRYRPAVRD